MWKGIQEEESIFTMMSAMARQHDAINLAQGFPNFNPDSRLIDILRSVAGDSIHQYAPMSGIPLLRMALANKIHDFYGVEWEPDQELTITAGATQAIYSVLHACVQQGDEVIILDPAYDAYRPGVLMAGACPVHVPLTYEGDGFQWNWDAVREAITHRTRLIIVNQPHNPTGILLTRDDWHQLEKIVLDNDLLLLCDEVYEHMVFDGKSFISACTRTNVRERLFCVGSFGKTYHNTGWKVGYVLACADWMRRFRQVHQFVVFSVNSLAQYVLGQFLTVDNTYRSLPGFYEQKRDYFLKEMEQTRFIMLPCKATYFQLADYSQISSKVRDVDFCRNLIRKWGVAAIPLSPFMHINPIKQLIRFCFAKTDDVLKSAAQRLSEC
jgi:methionine aminotransferase